MSRILHRHSRSNYPIAVSGDGPYLVDIQGKRRVLHNIMEELTVANYLGLFAILDVTISAEVIEFTGSKS